jgi:hypothetical protein
MRLLDRATVSNFRSWRTPETRQRGCQIFLGPNQTYQNGKNIPNDHKLYKMAIQCKKWLQSAPNGHKICQHIPIKGPPKYTQIGIFGTKSKPSGNPARQEPLPIEIKNFVERKNSQLNDNNKSSAKEIIAKHIALWHGPWVSSPPAELWVVGSNPAWV